MNSLRSWWTVVVGIALCASWPACAQDPRPLMQAVQQNYSGGPITFTVFGEAKGGCGISTCMQYAAQKAPTDFSATLGDQLTYANPSWGQHKCAEWYENQYPTWPVKGDQDRGYESYYGLPTADYYFDYGPARFLFMDYVGHAYQKPDRPTTNYDTGAKTTIREALEEAKARGKHVFVFCHTQYYSSGSGTKKYANKPPRSMTRLFEQSNVRMVFQGDNPGYSNIKKNGVYYIRPSGATGKTKRLFIFHVEVNGGTIAGKQVYLDGRVGDTVTIKAPPPPPPLPSSRSRSAPRN